jgi:hypothetical protein
MPSSITGPAGILTSISAARLGDWADVIPPSFALRQVNQSSLEGGASKSLMQIKRAGAMPKRRVLPTTGASLSHLRPEQYHRTQK